VERFRKNGIRLALLGRGRIFTAAFPRLPCPEIRVIGGSHRSKLSGVTSRRILRTTSGEWRNTRIGLSGDALHKNRLL